MEAFMIPKRLDEPERFLFWTYDEAFVVFVPAVTGMVLGGLITGVAIGWCGWWGLRKFKGNGSANLARIALYWYLPDFYRFKVTPLSVIRRYV